MATMAVARRPAAVRYSQLWPGASPPCGSDQPHLILGLAAGLMLGVVGFDLVPEALTQQPGELFGVPVLMLAVLGFLTLHIVERSVAIHRGHLAVRERPPTRFDPARRRRPRPRDGCRHHARLQHPPPIPA